MCDYEDGSFESFDCSMLEVLEPTSLKKQMCIHFSYPPESDSPWRIVGKQVKFSIKEEYLKKNNDIFDGALKDILFS